MIAAEFKIFKLLSVFRLNERTYLFEIQPCIDAALLDIVGQVLKELVDLSLAKAWISSTVVKRELEISQPCILAQLSIHQLFEDARLFRSLLIYITVIVVDYYELF